jgi:hypothetical protein
MACSGLLDSGFTLITLSVLPALAVASCLVLPSEPAKMPLHLIDFYNFKPPADLLVDREEGHAIRVNAAKTSLVSRCSPAQDEAASVVLVERQQRIILMLHNSRCQGRCRVL